MSKGDAVDYFAQMKNSPDTINYSKLDVVFHEGLATVIEKEDAA